MKYTAIDMENYTRKAHFDYFRSLGYPYMGTTVNVDVSELVKVCKENKVSFYLAFMHAAALAADSVEEMRCRIMNGGIIRYDNCCTSHIELLADGTYCYCTLHHDLEWKDYIPYAEKTREKCRRGGSIEEDENVLNYYFVSTLPWFSYTAIIQPVAGGDESNPRITWGRYEKDCNGRLMMPLTVLAHHSLVDGMHLAKFYENIKTEMDRISENINSHAK